jgi:hypothetical protein
MHRSNPDHQARLEALASAMATGESVGKWADSAGVARATAYRWARLPGVRARVAQIRRAITDQAIAVLVRASGGAAGTLWTIMSDPAEASAIRLSAAKAVISSYIAMESHAAMAARFEDLQRQIDALKSRKRGSKT